MERNLRKTRVGVFVSDKMDKTIVADVCVSLAGTAQYTEAH